MAAQSSTNRAPRPASTISQLQGDAWAAWNASFYAEEKDLYREFGRALYNQDVHERIQSLFSRSDEQNARLDALLLQFGN